MCIYVYSNITSSRFFLDRLDGGLSYRWLCMPVACYVFIFCWFLIAWKLLFKALLDCKFKHFINYLHYICCRWTFCPHMLSLDVRDFIHTDSVSLCTLLQEVRVLSSQTECRGEKNQWFGFCCVWKLYFTGKKIGHFIQYRYIIYYFKHRHRVGHIDIENGSALLPHLTVTSA